MGLKQTHEVFTNTIYRCNAAVERFAQRPYWMLYVTAACVVFSILCSFPRIEIWRGDYSAFPEAQNVARQIENPFTPVVDSGETHSAKTQFRLFFPVIAHFLGLSFGACKIIELLFGALLFLCVIRLSWKITDDPVIAVLVGGLTASIFVGSTAFVEFRGMFDGVAVCFLLAACCFNSALWNFVIVFCACWIDERALIASPLVILFHLKNTQTLGDISKSLRTYPVYAIVFAWVLYFSLRFYLSHFCGFITHTDAVGFGVFTRQVHGIPGGIWSAFEGGWLIITLAFMSVFMAKRYGFFFAWLFASLLSLTIALMVCDITRSMAYLFPAFLIAIKELSLSVKSQQEQELFRYYLYVAVLVSVLWPNIYFGGNETWWFSAPMPIKLMQFFIQ